MKTRTINTAIYAKIEEWLNSIQDLPLRNLLHDKIVVTGGCITSMLLREPVNDYDVYFTTREATLAAANYYIKLFQERTKNKYNIMVDDSYKDRVSIKVKSIGVAKDATLSSEMPVDDAEQIETFIAPAPARGVVSAPAPKAAIGIPIYLSTNAITLSGKIQLVTRFYGTPEEIHKNFDFVHCTNYYSTELAMKTGTGLVLNTQALSSILTKELIYTGSLYPICSVIRLRKFIKRDWTIHAGYILKMSMQISELDLKNVTVLMDQLTGVDALYFSMLIWRLTEQAEDGSAKEITASYVAELVDAMMNEG